MSTHIKDQNRKISTERIMFVPLFLDLEFTYFTSYGERKLVYLLTRQS